MSVAEIGRRTEEDVGAADSYSLLKKEFPQIREKLWKDAFWSKSFCLLTAGGAPVEVIRSYIETQGEKIHEKGRWKNV